MSCFRWLVGWPWDWMHLTVMAALHVYSRLTELADFGLKNGRMRRDLRVYFDLSLRYKVTRDGRWEVMLLFLSEVDRSGDSIMWYLEDMSLVLLFLLDDLIWMLLPLVSTTY